MEAISVSNTRDHIHNRSYLSMVKIYGFCHNCGQKYLVIFVFVFVQFTIGLILSLDLTRRLT